MPLYEYVCADCEKKFERYVRAWGEAVACPGCQSGAVEKQLSSFAMSGGASRPDAGSGSMAGGSCCGGGCGCAH
jgi:putative FmdB family regulatory protein